jgi:Rieske Fe-S protein
MRRREFVQRLPVIGSGLLLGASSLSVTGCGGVRYVVPTAAAGALVIDAGVLGQEGEAFVQGQGMNRPIYVRRTAAGGLVALLASCTHNGCQPSPAAGRLVCPCHGSEFSLEGDVLQGPADRPLTRYEVTEANGSVQVWLDRTVVR